MLSASFYSLLGGALLGAALLNGCSQGPPTPVAPTNKPATSTELTFDRRYLDSLSAGPPYSARTQRQLAIMLQLKRLGMYTEPRFRSKEGNPQDSIYEHVGDGPLVGFANRAEHLADIHRKMDSLKVLENIPLTPHTNP